MKRILSVVLCVIAAMSSRVFADIPQEWVELKIKNGSEFVSGDTVRFSAQLTGNLGSRYLYVELLDPFGEVHNRVKIKEQNGKFDGYVPLDRELPEGTYTLAAYTMYMQNRGADYFYRTPLEVRSIYSAKYRIEPKFSEKTLTVSLTEAATGVPVKSESLKLYSRKGMIRDAGRKKSSYRFKIPENVATVKVVFDNFSKFIALPVDSSEAVLEFFPEGGAMVPHVSNAVAIKTTDVDGRPMALSGTIVDKSGDVISTFRTDSAGLGETYIFPLEGEPYFAKIGNKSYALPMAKSTATSLQVVNRGEQFVVNVLGEQPSGLLLEANVGGVTEMMLAEPHFPLTISRDKFSAEPVNFTLLNANGEVVSSRIANGNSSLAQMLTMPIEPRDISRWPVEIGGEITGIVKSHWLGKPLKNATVKIIAPAERIAETALTDENGRFRINGIDWPEGTQFAVEAVNANGNREHNFIVDNDTFPTIRPLPQPVNFEREVGPEYAELLHSGITLNEITITARRSPEQMFTDMYKALGARLIDNATITGKSMTTYEEAIRSIASLRIVDGRVISTRALRGITSSSALPQVPLCLGGVVWNGGNSEAPEAAASTTIAGGTTTAGDQAAANGMPSPASVSVDLSSDAIPQIKQFAEIYPFHLVKSIMYLPPGVAAAYGSVAANYGIIMVELKDFKDNGLNYNPFVQVFRPLGYQQ